MIEKLFSSSVRVKLLRLFLANYDKKYYVRELTRKLDTQINSIRREVENLSSLGLLKVVGDDNDTQKKYFQINKDFPLLNELKALILKSHLVLGGGIIKELSKIGTTSYLVLTGIFVNNSHSPIDILIVGNLNKKKLTEIIEKIEKALGRSINYTIMKQKEFFYRRDLADKFLYNILNSPKITLINNLKIK